MIDGKVKKKFRSSHLGYTFINAIEHVFRIIGCFGKKGNLKTKEVSVEVNIVPLDWIVEETAATNAFELLRLLPILE